MKGNRGFGRKALVACAAALAVALVGFAGNASATDYLIPTKIGLVKFGGSPATGRLYKLVAKAPKPTLFTLPAADPAATGGSLEVGVSPGRLDCTLSAGAFDGTVGWKTLGPPATPKGYKYLNKNAGTVPGADPCKIVILKEKVIKVIARGTGGIPAPMDRGLNPDVDTKLALGGDNYCAESLTPHFKAKADRLIKSKSQGAPGACPIIPTTTTTTTVAGTTTTTGGATTTTTGGATTTTTSGATTTTTGGATTTTTSGATTTTTTVVPTTTTTSVTVPTTTTTSTTVQPTTTTTTTLPPPPLDHFRLYNAFGPDGPPVHIVDQFHVEDVDLGLVKYFLVPVDKNGEGIILPTDHLTCYDVPVGTFPASVTVDNQFGPQTLQVTRPDALCVPTEKFPDVVSNPLERDHYKCYEAFGDPVSMMVNLVDQFEDQPGVTVFEPILFCNPADKNDEGVRNLLDHLTCYMTDPPGAAAGLIPIRNQFHEDSVDVGPSVALCVPSDKLGWTPGTTTTTSVTVPTTTTTIIPTTTTTVVPTTTTTTLPPPPLDHYRLYDALGPDAPFVHIVDQFHVEDVDLGMVRWFLVPVDKNGEGINTPLDHLTCYDVPVGTFPASVTVDNQFGLQSLQVTRPAALCVPSEKFPDMVPVPPERDHYKCYEAFGDPVNVQVNLVDQFEDQPGVTVFEPILFCNPADKNDEGVRNLVDHLTCYMTNPPGVPAGMIPIRNQFHEDVLNVGPSVALCVPSLKLGWTPGTTTTTMQGTTTTVDQTTTTSTTSAPTTTTMQGPIDCELSLPPQCDGACPPGQECTEGIPGQCICEMSIAVCGDGTFGPPQCWGSCPPELPICRDTGGLCECMPF